MRDTTRADVFVMLCDWRGNCHWTSDPQSEVVPGEPAWQHLEPKSQRAAKDVLAKVVALRETHRLDVTDHEGVHFRGWLWPLDSPEVAVCILGVRVPKNLSALTERERECLELLGQGVETRLIAERLDVSLSTVHTHLKRAREKLDLPSVEALISFAARYFFPMDRPLAAPQ